jgi:hypothetical protein
LCLPNVVLPKGIFYQNSGILPNVVLPKGILPIAVVPHISLFLWVQKLQP